MVSKPVIDQAHRRFDVCNGDADGLCAVLQWRLSEPAVATLVTGLKREISLLERVPADAADEVLVCDISMQRNRAALQHLLDAGVRVHYFDHHAVEDVPRHPKLDAHIDLGSETCSSLLMDKHLGGRFRKWALVGAYGDGLSDAPNALAASMGLDAQQRLVLQRLGQAINYNAYGEDVTDVHIAPARLYEIMARYADPLQMLIHERVAVDLDHLRRADLELAGEVAPYWHDENACVYLLPDMPWSRRVMGCLANELAQAHPEHSHAVLKIRRTGDYAVSVRAPHAAAGGADALCAQFGGSGRATAAGIDHLPASDVDRFILAFGAARWAAQRSAQPSST